MSKVPKCTCKQKRVHVRVCVRVRVRVHVCVRVRVPVRVWGSLPPARGRVHL